MWFFAFLFIYFLLNVTLSLTFQVKRNSLISKNNLTIRKTSFRWGYTTKELTQLFNQVESTSLNKQISGLIKLQRLMSWAWYGYLAIFVIMGALVIVSNF